MESITSRSTNRIRLKKLPIQYTEQYHKEIRKSGNEYADPHSFWEMNYPLDPWFPHPHYIIGIHDKDTLPPLFYVYCQNTAMAFDLRTYELVGIKRKGRNPKIVKHVLKKIKKWLNTIEPVFEPKTYGEHMRHSWSNDGMAITSDGQLLTVDEWKKVFLKETEEDNKNIDYSIPPIDTDGYIEPK